MYVMGKGDNRREVRVVVFSVTIGALYTFRYVEFKDGKPHTCSFRDFTPCGEGEDELREGIALMLGALTQPPLLARTGTNDQDSFVIRELPHDPKQVPRFWSRHEATDPLTMRGELRRLGGELPDADLSVALLFLRGLLTAGTNDAGTP